MPVRRLHRRLIAWLIVACVLFAQTAAVAYACPLDRFPGEEATTLCAAHIASESEPAKGSPIDANVCEIHCHPASLPDFTGFDLPPSVPVAAWWRLPEVAAPWRATHVAELEARSAAPPPRTLFARLLI